MKRILVPTDFSPTAERAFRFAKMLAEKSEATIILYHVYTPVKNAFVEVGTDKDEYNRQTEKGLLTKLDRLKKKVIADADISVSTVIGYAPVVDNILGFAEQNFIDLIIMGTQGATGIKKVIVGSVAAKVLNETEIPLILIPEKYELKYPETILYATHIFDYNPEIFSMLSRLAGFFDAELKIVHLYSESSGVGSFEETSEEFEKFKGKVLCNVEYAKTECRLIRTNDVLKELETLHNIIPYDIMVMVKRQKATLDKLLFKSFTREMAYATEYPLLIIQEEKE